MGLEVGDWFQEAVEDASLLDKLRWSTLGYHHNWDTKVYSEDRRGTFPPELSRLTQALASALGHQTFTPEAAIVNFYPASGCLSPHTDHSEPNLSVPLLSISLGLPAIFLIGTASLDTIPAALLLKTGDVLVMEAEARLAYHAVPKIIKLTSAGGTSGDRVKGSFRMEYLRVRS